MSKTVYVEQGSLLPEFNRNVPYWNSINNVNINPDGRLYYDQEPGYYDQDTNEELNTKEFAI